MKKGLLLVMAILCCASLVLAQAPGSIAVYLSTGEAPPGPYIGDGNESCGGAEGPYPTYYFFHVADECATACEFVFDITGTSYISFGFNSPFALVSGGINSGLSISYGGFLTGAIYLGSATYQALAPTPACTNLYVKGHPIPSVSGATVPLAIDCGANAVPPVDPDFLFLRGSYVTVNPDETCPCEGTVPNEETSWGQIKSLYN
jgi:hypothetical protein